MKRANAQAVDTVMDWRDLVDVALSFPSLFNVEWLIDKAEVGEWGGLWW